MKDKRGQMEYPLIAFVILIVSLMILAPVMLKIFNSVQTPMSNSFGNLTDNGGAIAQANYNQVMDVGVNMWDKVILFAFILATLLLIISAFLIDTNPVWIILYIFISFMFILFAGDIVGALDGIYNSASFATETAQLAFIGSLRDNFATILVGLMLLTGIIIYGKIALTSRGGGRR